MGISMMIVVVITIIVIWRVIFVNNVNSYKFIFHLIWKNESIIFAKIKKKKGREEHLRKKSQELFCKIILHPLIIERK